MGANGRSVVLVERFEIRKSRKGEDYASLRVNLGRPGRFGALDAKIWRFDRFLAARRPLPQQGDLIQADYEAQEFRGLPQWTIQDYEVLTGEARHAALADFVQPRRIDAEFYQDRLERLMGEADSDRVSARALAEIFDRAAFREAFFAAPAAVSHHQNYPGGLLEHTVNVTTLALALADAYGSGGLSLNGERPPVDRTLLISAGLLHDIGKIDSYAFSPLPSPTDANRFEGHLSIGYAVVRGVVSRLRDPPPYPGAADELDKLLNCILSHHGALEFGSPVTPACLEAFFLAQADLTDARVASVVTEGYQALRLNPGARWLTHYHFPGGVFLGDWPKPPDAPK